MINLNKYQPVREMSRNLVRVPGLITDNPGFLEDFTLAYNEVAQGNPYLTRLQNGKGSNPLIGGLANKVLQGTGFRVATPTDDVYSGIFPLVEEKHYTDLNAFDVWGQKPNYTPNQAIWEDVINLARQQKGGDVEFPFRIQGFNVVPDESSGGIYQVRLEAAPNFRLIEDEKINLKGGFNELDENGMIVQEEEGRFTRYAIGNGLSRVSLGYIGDLGSDYGNIVNSIGGGRVVLVGTDN